MTTTTYNLVVLHKGALLNPISCEVVRNSAGNCKAYVQVRTLDYSGVKRGTGHATGYGYNKETASVIEALNKAGFNYSDMPEGVSVPQILAKLAGKMGARGKFIIV